MKRAVNRLIPRRLGTSVVKKLDISAIQDFYILLDDPHRVYLPGDQIRGEIFLILNKNLANATIDLSLMGNIKVKNSIATNSFRSKKQCLFNHVTRIYPGQQHAPAQDGDSAGDSAGEPAGDPADDYDHLQSGLTKGQHIFPFIAQLPERNIISSISFEKGQIGYKLKASVGEANGDSESPLFACEKQLNVVKPINVASLPPPKVKTLIVKYPTKRLQKTFSQNSSSAISVASHDVAGAGAAAGNSATTPNNNSNGMATDSPDLPSPDSVPATAPPAVADRSAIKLSIEVPSLGYLRGELVPVKVSLQHIKSAKNVNGIIITLIRICNVDFGPDGPIQSFRKDLFQTIAPLFVDPVTFRAEVNTSVRIPADAFPTILGNDIVTFKYAVEVIVNLSNAKSMTNNMAAGKIQDDESLDGITPGAAQSSSNSPSEFFGVTNNNAAAASTIFNVDKLKRMKNVLTLNTEIIVGTLRKERTARRSSRRHQHRPRTTGAGAELASNVSESSNPTQTTPLSSDTYDQPPPIEHYSNNSSPEELSQGYATPLNSLGLQTPASLTAPLQQVQGAAAVHVFPPSIPEFDNMTEKQILQLRERTLLPSNPPMVGTSSRVGSQTTSSPLADHLGGDDIDYVPTYEPPPQSSRHSLSDAADESAPNGQHAVVADDDLDDLYTNSKLVNQIEGINVDVDRDPVRLNMSNGH